MIRSLVRIQQGLPLAYADTGRLDYAPPFDGNGL
ncbi:MAG: hypothetical protein JWO86_4848 [Myxococcaceae bacterium]|nr:hypothetical protein [Myxococcaceae bacterium]MEA2751844.1 hypothetical protein [Myxococcales bacterium]